MNKATLFWINGPVVKAQPSTGFAMKEAAFIGKDRLAAEVIRLEKDQVTLQVYEDTTGLTPGTEVVSEGQPMMVELGPGLLGKMFDGVQRPLGKMAEVHGDYVTPGATISGLDRDQRWNFSPLIGPGEMLSGGAVLGEVEETPALKHKIMPSDHGFL